MGELGSWVDHGEVEGRRRGAGSQRTTPTPLALEVEALRLRRPVGNLAHTAVRSEQELARFLVLI